MSISLRMLVAKLHRLFLCLFLCVASTLLAPVSGFPANDVSTVPVATGLIVTFKNDLGPRGYLDQRMKIENDLHTQLLYRSTTQTVDVLRAKAAEAKNLASLKTLCSAFEKNEVVTACELNYQKPEHSRTLPSDCIPAQNSVIPASSIGFVNNFINNQHCNLVPTDGIDPLENGTLSPLWGQEYIGADLAQDALSGVPLSSTPIAVVDAPFEVNKIPKNKILPNALVDTCTSVSCDTHSTGTTDVFIGPPGAQVASTANFVALIKEEGNVSDFIRAGDLLASSHHAKIVNFSTAIGNSDSVFRSFKKLTDQNTIMVVAIGNSFPRDYLELNEQRLNVVTVGSAAPNGLVSNFSQQSQNVVVLAPGDNNLIRSLDASGKVVTHGGTSASAPFVSQALSDLSAVLPQITIDDAKTLLRLTATPLISSRMPVGQQKDGAGLLNEIKLIEVAKRLKKLGYPARSQNLISDPSLLNFKSESESDFSEGSNLLKSTSCSDRQMGLRLLRRSYLLNPNETARTLLITTYSDLGLSENANFFKSLSPDFTSYMQSKFSQLDQTSVSTNDLFNQDGEKLFTFASRFPPENSVHQMAAQLLQKRFSELKPGGYIFSPDYINLYSTPMMSAGLTNSNQEPYVEQMFVVAVDEPGLRQSALDRLQPLLNDGSAEVRAKAAWIRVKQIIELNGQLKYEAGYLKPEEEGISKPLPANALINALTLALTQPSDDGKIYILGNLHDLFASSGTLTTSDTARCFILLESVLNASANDPSVLSVLTHTLASGTVAQAGGLAVLKRHVNDPDPKIGQAVKSALGL